MPNETQQAVNWALQQEYPTDEGYKKVTKNDSIWLVTFVRQYFNENNIEYNTFSYEDLKSYLN